LCHAVPQICGHIKYIKIKEDKIMAMPHGLKAREYAKYRLTRNGEVAVGVTNEDEANIETLEVTASGDTLILPSPGSTEYLTIKGFHFSNDGAKVTVGLRAGTGGKEKFSTTLIANGGNFDKNLIGRYWRLPINKALYVVLSGAGTVLVTVEYEGMEEPGPESAELTDALVITEALATDVSSVLGDAQVLTNADALAIEASHVLADAQALTDSGIVYTESKVIALGDAVGIAESVGNQTTTELAESDTLVITESVDVDLSPSI
jgi:hypothetical protein